MSRIKEAFVSRFDGGVILNLDFSQLEVNGLAILSQDQQLIEDILAGRDMHRYFASQLFGITEAEVTKAQRDVVKKFTFALQYGSGAKGLAAKNGTSVEVAQAFIDTYYARYTGVKAWQERVEAAVRASRRNTGERTPDGYPIGVGEYESITGRLYFFFEKADFRGEASLKPTEMKNYPVQGLATGDIMALFRARVYRRWITLPWRAHCLPINTVHDSVMFDCSSMEYAKQMKVLMDEVVASLEGELKRLWGIDLPVPLKTETEAGPSWADMSKL